MASYHETWVRALILRHFIREEKKNNIPPQFIITTGRLWQRREENGKQWVCWKVPLQSNAVLGFSHSLKEKRWKKGFLHSFLSCTESEKVQTASPMPLSKADYGSVSPSSFDSPHTHTQEAPLPCSPLSHDLVRIVKISPFDKANWTTCQRMFSSLVNHICSLISTHSRTQQTLHHLIQSTSHCCESSTGSRRGQEETERLRDNERKKERKEVIKRSLGR